MIYAACNKMVQVQPSLCLVTFPLAHLIKSFVATTLPASLFYARKSLTTHSFV